MYMRLRDQINLLPTSTLNIPLILYFYKMFVCYLYNITKKAKYQVVICLLPDVMMSGISKV